jgi:prepilin-type N-terminal cleavage/methylation domain-containing protein
MQKQNKKKDGFTLIELMVVIVIMGVISAVAVPNIFGLVEKSREKVDLMKLFYLRDAINRALIEDEAALSNSAYIADASGDEKTNRQNKLDGALEGNQGVTLFVIEVKNGVSVNVQGSHGKANDNVNMCQLIGSGGTWYTALKESGFDGVADIVASRLNKTDYNKLDQSSSSYYAKKDGSNCGHTPRTLCL